MRQSSRYFFKYLTKRLEQQSLKPSDLDPWLFIGDTVTVIIYVDAVVVYTRDSGNIGDLIKKLREHNILLLQEDTAGG